MKSWIKKSFSWMWKFITAVLVGIVVYKLASADLSPIKQFVSNLETYLLQKKLISLNSLLVLLVIIISIFIVIFLKRKRRFGSLRREIIRYFYPFKKIKHVNPGIDLKIPQFTDNYYKQPQDEEIKKKIKSKKHILIKGLPDRGKTRIAWEVIKNYKNYFLVLLSSNINVSDLENISFDIFVRKKIVLFLDDYHELVSIPLVALISTISEEASSIIIIATCRSGTDYHRAREQNADLLDFFESVNLPELDRNQGQALAEQVGISWDEKKKLFAGTPGSILLDNWYEVMRDRYNRLSAHAKYFLCTLKFLNLSGIFTPPLNVVEKAFQLLYRISLNFSEKQKMYNELVNESELLRDFDPPNIYSAYFTQVIFDDPFHQSILENAQVELFKHFKKENDYQNIINMAYKFFYMNRFDKASSYLSSIDIGNIKNVYILKKFLRLKRRIQEKSQG